VLDDGRLTDAQGRTVDFRNTIIIMTSNLGSQYIMEPGLTSAQIEERVMAALRESFRPELLNRIDEVVIFQPLGRAQIAQIAEIQLRDLRQRLAERDMTLELTPAARERLADIGFDPVYGARPLRRAIQQRIVHPLAVRLLSGDFHDGDTIVVDATGEQFTFTAAAAPQQQASS
jgi:ATP-dependent Clp protease ATP-binding subunit ClpB